MKHSATTVTVASDVIALPVTTSVGQVSNQSDSKLHEPFTWQELTESIESDH